MASLAEWNTPAAAPGGSTSVLGRIISILDAVKESGGSISITEIAAHTAMPKSTASRLVAELTRQRYLQRTEDGVTLGLRLFELGARANFPRRLIAAAAPIIQDLCDVTGERVGLWVHQGTDMISLAAVAGRLPMLPARAGMRSPALTTASGKAYLAFCADQGVVDRVSAPLVDDAADQFRSELREVRSAVVAVDRGVAYPGILAVASPVLAGDRTVLGAISIAGPSGGMDPDRAAPLVRAAGIALSRRLTAA
ncbi:MULTISPECIES: IclR family transcriptional regulator [unclassified Microbacterium]|uniref:IclR family transcriptional regulator n=1 Tax=unclassified Microbacterium TaxID=2609290 RepID=UPI00214B6146|nr:MULTISPECIES: IclR family transcriptional regulator [unclassified Microbacterium]MCR2785944.1 IclR family transcriptional regulator [Microbacterium sp. zg.B96]MDL5353162.1 IclR family transcriptional regulator [Microbacterium sp. zg-YB36]WIM17083.1 IclR family transcriptional regulator [Microbacterium sp. zg-B96]